MFDSYALLLFEIVFFQSKGKKHKSNNEQIVHKVIEYVFAELDVAS